MELEESWARVTAWLAAHAPASYATLNPPATAAELDACEQVLTVPLPSDLRRLLLVNNGAAELDPDETYHREAAFLPVGHRPLSATELALESRDLVGIARGIGEDMLGCWWDPEWVLFGRDVAACGMAIDQRPGPRQGAVGEFDLGGNMEFTMGASLAEYLAKVADSIENGTDFCYLRPAVKAGSLDWDVIVETDASGVG